VSIPFPGSGTLVDTTIDVAGGGLVCAWEILCVGRVARGERVVLNELVQRTRVRVEDEVVLDERQRIASDEADAVRDAFPATHIGLLTVAGPPGLITAGRLREVMTLSADVAGTSEIAPGVIVCKAHGASSEELERAFWPAVTTVRAHAGLRALSAGRVARRWL
jgi:urease accessory protein UreH